MGFLPIQRVGRAVPGLGSARGQVGGRCQCRSRQGLGRRIKCQQRELSWQLGRDVLIVGRLRDRILGLVLEAGVGGKMWEEASCRHAEGSINAKMQVFARNDTFALRQQPKSIQESSLLHAEAGTVQPPCPVPRQGAGITRTVSASLLHISAGPQQGFYSVQQTPSLTVAVTVFFPCHPGPRCFWCQCFSKCYSRLPCVHPGELWALGGGGAAPQDSQPHPGVPGAAAQHRQQQEAGMSVAGSQVPVPGSIVKYCSFDTFSGILYEVGSMCQSP